MPEENKKRKLERKKNKKDETFSNISKEQATIIKQQLDEESEDHKEE